MDNPFLKRATEQFRGDHEAFLAVVTPEPITHFLGPHGNSGELYDRLVIIEGTPGSGKTTIAQLFEYPTLSALLRNPDPFGPLYEAMTRIGAIRDTDAMVLGCRLSMETDYRDCWEFTYPTEVKLGLMQSLIQARAVLAWTYNLMDAGIDIQRASIVPRADVAAAVELIGGTNLAAVEMKARDIELSIYQVIASLIAPNIGDLDASATGAYHPLDVIDKVRVVVGPQEQERTVDLLPLLILDDAHILHPAQFEGLRRWLARRELRPARWMMTRLDVLPVAEALSIVTDDKRSHVSLPGITTDRDFIHVPLQSTGDRRDSRKAFRKMARDMADRYLRKMPLFHNRGHNNFSHLLLTQPPRLTPSRRKDLEARVAAVQAELKVTDNRLAELNALIDKFDPDRTKVPDEVRLAILRILMYRYFKRTGQGSLFGIEDDPEPSRPIVVDTGVVEAAKLHLLHDYGRAFFYGIDDVCDASSENAEQFLHLAATLVEQSSVHLVRSKSPSLEPAAQHKLLQQRADDIIHDWNFPKYAEVKRLIAEVSRRCLEVTATPNAWIGAGANAYGIFQAEADELTTKHPDLASVLKFGVAYNAFSLIPNYQNKGKVWFLIELGGIVILQQGLTLMRGGFIEGSVRELARFVATNP